MGHVTPPGNITDQKNEKRAANVGMIAQGGVKVKRAGKSAR